MSDIKTWFLSNWEVLGTAVGLGSGSRLVTKKLTDREQDKKIKALENDVSEIKTKLAVNTELDNQRQAALSITLDKIDKRFDRMEDKLDRILENQNKRTR
jgi:hypothetical protein